MVDIALYDWCSDWGDDMHPNIHLRGLQIMLMERMNKLLFK